MEKIDIPVCLLEDYAGCDFKKKIVLQRTPEMEVTISVCGDASDSMNTNKRYYPNCKHRVIGELTYNEEK